MKKAKKELEASVPRSPTVRHGDASNLLGRSIDTAADISAARAAAEKAQAQMKVLAQAREIVARKSLETANKFNERRASNNKEDEDEDDDEDYETESEEEDVRYEDDISNKIRGGRNHEPNILVIE